MNKAACRCIGASSAEEVIGLAPSKCVHPIHREEAAKRLNRIVDNALEISNVEEIYQRLDGTPFHAEIAATPFTFNGQAAALVFFRDVTPRKKTERALQESEARLRALFDSVQDIIYLKDTEGRYTHINKAMEHAFNKQAHEIVGHTDEALFSPEAAREIRTIDLQVLKGRLIRGEYSRFISGEQKIIESIKSPCAMKTAASPAYAAYREM